MKKRLWVFAVFSAALILFFACNNNSDGPGGGSGNLNISVLRLNDGTTSRPQSHVFVQNSTGGDYVEITVANIDPDASGAFKIDYTITDIFGTDVEAGTIDCNSGEAAGSTTLTRRIPIDKSKLGHFTFRASIQGGVRALSLPRTGYGTRPTNIIGYIVVPDPATRRMNGSGENTGNQMIRPDVDKSIYFGMAIIPGHRFDGVVDPITYFGIDASISGQFNWKNTFWEGPAENPGVPLEVLSTGYTNVEKLVEFAKPNGVWGDPWTGQPSPVASSLKTQILYLAEMAAYMPKGTRTEAGLSGSYGGELSEYGKGELAKYCEGMARMYIVHASHRPIHYFQLLWEPVSWWSGWLPRGEAGDRSIVEAYRVAYEAIHKVYDEHAEATGDPTWKSRAVVLGPTSSDAAVYRRSLDWHEGVYKMGLMNYLDGLSFHPYNDIKASQGDSSVEDVYNDYIRDIKKMTTEYYDARTAEYPRYHDKPFFWGTEQGLREANNGVVRSAQVLTRQTLVLLGEGYDANHNFCFTDYERDERYGFFYNCTPMIDQLEVYGAQYISPKPQAAAFAATTLLMKGFKPVFDGSGSARLPIVGNGTQWGYKYKDTWEANSDALMYAVWDHGEGASSEAAINVEPGRITVYDMVGNDITDKVSISGSTVNLTLTEYVQYIKVEP